MQVGGVELSCRNCDYHRWFQFGPNRIARAKRIGEATECCTDTDMDINVTYV